MRTAIGRLRQSIAGAITTASTTIEKTRAEFNFDSIRAHVAPMSRVLDVGAWRCYLGMFLRDRLDCDVLSLDVVDASRTDVPFRLFDGRTLPVESRAFDVVLFLYVLHHAADDGILLREARRALADTGRLIVAEDCVDGLWNRARTIGFHVWLWMVTRMTWHQFRTTGEWEERFREIGFDVSTRVDLGPHLGRRLWPRNTLFVLTKSAAREAAAG